MSIGDLIQKLLKVDISSPKGDAPETVPQSPKQDQSPNQNPKEPDIRDIKPNPRLDEGQ